MAHEITLPRLGWSMEEGTFLGWRKRDGDAVRAGEILFELESEKATQEIEALDSGILRIPADAPAVGSVVPVGALLGYLVAEGEAAPFESRQTARRPDTIPGAPASASLESSPSGVNRSPSALPPRGSRPIASPRARRVAAELGIDWSRLVGTGGNGRVRERDVRQAAAAPVRSPSQVPPSLSPVAHAPGTVPEADTTPSHLPHSPRRRTIGQRMLASRQQTAAVTLTSRADATNLVNLREQFKTAGQAPLPSYTDIIARLAAAALRKHPRLGARWEEERLVLPEGLHIGIAVDCEEGLLVPVVRDVDRLSLLELAARSRDLVERARAGRLSAAEQQGGVLTITNLGGYGIEAFTPIINPPETAVLGVGAIRREPVVHDEQIVPRDQVTLSLTFDHRVVDGAPAARFLKTLREAIENPAACLLENR